MAADSLTASRNLAGALAPIAKRIVACGAAWKISESEVAAALTKSLDSWGGLARGESPDPYLRSLHCEDLALAIACAGGGATAWDKFIAAYRPILYASARAICRDEMAAREAADSLWAELYGVEMRAGKRRSLLDYFHGRSSLATWLRAVVAQRHLDTVRAARRFEPLEKAPEPVAVQASDDPPEPAHEPLMETFANALRAALSELEPRDRMRLNYYYRDELTLREVARLMDEHESTVSRKLERCRRELKKRVERKLRMHHRLSEEQIRLCYDRAAEDAPFRLDADLSSSAGSVVSQRKERGSF